jgi:pyruvate/2-oxoglutarate dehydrogenase complex dihydrolipoamide dehydrogenase (E3) component
VLVVGSGYVAVELGGVFRALGAEVTVAVRHDGVLRSFDPMLREVLMDEMRKDGIRIETGAVPVAVCRKNDRPGAAHDRRSPARRRRCAAVGGGARALHRRAGPGAGRRAHR